MAAAQDQDLKSLLNLIDDNHICPTKSENIVDIVTFAQSINFLGLKLYPVQKFILKLFYKIPLEDKVKEIKFRDFYSKTHYEFTEVEYLHHLSGSKFDIRPRINLKEPPKHQLFSELQLVCGRRSGKDFLSSIIVAYETYKLIKLENPQAHYGLADGDIITINNIASTGEQSRILFEAVKSRFLYCDFFKKYLVGEPTLEVIRMATPHDLEKRKNVGLSQGTIHIVCLSTSARNTRGATSILVLLDELAHFVDESVNLSAKTIYESLTPSVATFGLNGKIVTLSSPANKAGQFYNLYERSFQMSDNMIMVQIPTWEINISVGEQFLENEYKKDKDSFAREYGARFSNTVAGFIKYPEYLDACVNNRKESEFGIYNCSYYLALDPSYNGNGYAACLAHLETIYENNEMKDKIVIDLIKEWYAGHGKYQNDNVIDMSEIEEWIIAIRSVFNLKLVVFDQFESGYIVQNLTKRGVNATRIHFTASYNDAIYKNLKKIIYDGKFDIYNHEEAIKQMKELQETVKENGRIEVFAPKGEKDDMSDAIANACYQIYINEIEKRSKRIITQTMVQDTSSNGNFKQISALSKTVGSRSRVRDVVGMRDNVTRSRYYLINQMNRRRS